VASTTTATPQPVTKINSTLLCSNVPQTFISICVNDRNYRCYENNSTNIECYLINDNSNKCTNNMSNSLLCYDMNNITRITNRYIACLYQAYYTSHKETTSNSNSFIYCNYVAIENNKNQIKLNWYLLEVIGIPALVIVVLLCCLLTFCCCHGCCAHKKTPKEGKCDNVRVKPPVANTQCQDTVMV